MRLALNPAPTFPRCKIKRVNPAFRSVSTPRRTKDFPVVGPVNPAASLGRPCEPPLASEWSAEGSANGSKSSSLPPPGRD